MSSKPVTPGARTATITDSRPAATYSRGNAQATLPPVPTHDEIAFRAHELYVQSGYQGGREVEFWLQAERELREALER